MDIKLSDITQRRAEMLGEVGQAWVKALPDKVRQALADYGLTFVDSLPGGSASYLAIVTDGSGAERILKVVMPTDLDVTAEIAGLQAAKGRGYVGVFATDAATGIAIMERLGSPIADSGLAIQTQIERVTAALQESWQADTATQGLVCGEGKADWLENHIRHTPAKIGARFNTQMMHLAVDHIDVRRGTWCKQDFVLVHGDAHEYNFLAATGDPAGKYKLVDPDGLRFEAAYDLGILLRNWISAYRHVEPMKALRNRAAWLSEQTGVATQAIVSWGFVEIVSTGIHLVELGYVDEAQDYLQLGEAVATQMAST